MIRARTARWAPVGFAAVVVILTAPMAANLARPVAQEAPPAWPLAKWTPIPENPVFTGTGRETWDFKIRERGYILAGDDGTYRLWYTGYAVDRPPTMSLGLATSRDGVHWTPDPENPVFAGSWTETMMRRSPRRHVRHVCRG